MAAKCFVLEVQQHVPAQGFYHVGYLDQLFKTKAAAATYYDKQHPNMRGLNAHRTWCSDWHPETRLRCLVRPYNNEVCSIKVLPLSPPAPTASVTLTAAAPMARVNNVY